MIRKKSRISRSHLALWTSRPTAGSVGPVDLGTPFDAAARTGPCAEGSIGPWEVGGASWRPRTWETSPNQKQARIDIPKQTVPMWISIAILEQPFVSGCLGFQVVVRPGAPIVASDRSVRSDARSPDRSDARSSSTKICRRSNPLEMFPKELDNPGGRLNSKGG